MLTRAILALATLFLSASLAFADDAPPPRPDLTPRVEAAPTGPDLRAFFRGESSVSTSGAGSIQTGSELRYRGNELGHLLVGGNASDLGRHGTMQFWGKLDLHPGVEWLHLGGDIVGEAHKRAQAGAWLGLDLHKQRADLDLRFLFDCTYDMRSNNVGGRLDWTLAGPMLAGKDAALWLGVRVVAWYAKAEAFQLGVGLEVRMTAGVRFSLGVAIEKGVLPRWIARGAVSDTAAAVACFALSCRL